MTNEFVTYEQALALKELGFDEACFGTYRSTELIDANNGSRSYIMALNTLNGYRKYEDESDTPAPLKQQLFKWFRKKYGFDFYVSRNLPSVAYRDYHVVINDLWGPHNTRKTYEEAEDVCINELIKIVKQQDIEN